MRDIESRCIALVVSSIMRPDISDYLYLPMSILEWLSRGQEKRSDSLLGYRKEGKDAPMVNRYRILCMACPMSGHRLDLSV